MRNNVPFPFGLYTVTAGIPLFVCSMTQDASEGSVRGFCWKKTKTTATSSGLHAPFAILYFYGLLPLRSETYTRNVALAVGGKLFIVGPISIQKR